MEKRLGFLYLNTTIKNKSLNKKKSKIMTFMFIKIFIKSIQMGISPIFVDETGLMIENNCYRRWRLPKTDYNIGPYKNIKKRVNLLLSVSPKNIIFEQFISENTNQDIFIYFLNKLINNIELNERKNFITIMDNAKIHKTDKVIQICLKNKIKVLTITPYFSKLKMIEYVLGFFKNKIYKNVYNTLENSINDVKDLIKSEKLKFVLPNLYKHTLKNYLDFIEENNKNKFNLNDFYANLDEIND